MGGRALKRFATWFASAGGVWQTAWITIGLVAVETFNRHLDPHGFWLLYALTVYSAVTQPALAYTGNESAAKIEAMLTSIKALEEKILGEVEDW